MQDTDKSTFLFYLRPSLIGNAVGIAVTLAFTAIFALLLTLIDYNGVMLTIIAMICCGLGAFANGLSASKATKKNGLLTGAVSGFIFALILTALSLMLNSGSVSIQSAIKAAICVVCAALGGIVGVNVHKKNKLF
ncbi:MAG: TIGR04086 family membrane protein [Acutalibacteraceae bacterium]|nr:TIGR04086 family membrane protein [Acutalibacteraceae bacterium]